MNGWLELKNDMYPVSFNALFYEMVTFGNNNNNNNNNNDNDNDNNNNYNNNNNYYYYYYNFFKKNRLFTDSRV